MLFTALSDAAAINPESAPELTGALFNQHQASLAEIAAVKILLAHDAKMGAVTRSLPKNSQPRGAGESSLSFSAPVNAMLTSMMQTPMAAGDQLGPWRIVEKIGQGGMGAVYKAERADGQFSQTVAIKVLAGFASPIAIKNLLAERELLATLAHPNIARIVDGGQQNNGTPYLVMDYINGQSITQHCQKLAANGGGSGGGLAPVIKLFSSVCDAVFYAHQNLTLHCDIKPANIMIDEGGRAKLLDFGIAKLISAATTQDGTAPPYKAYTPAYSSPEQRDGEALSTATDIFSLGRVLSELLQTQASPRSWRERRRLAEAQAIAERASAIKTNARYASVADLNADLQRLLQGEAVNAVSERVFYKFYKLLIRRWGVACGVEIGRAHV